MLPNPNCRSHPLSCFDRLSAVSPRSYRTASRVGRSQTGLGSADAARLLRSTSWRCGRGGAFTLETRRRGSEWFWRLGGIEAFFGIAVLFKRRRLLCLMDAEDNPRTPIVLSSRRATGV